MAAASFEADSLTPEEQPYRIDPRRQPALRQQPLAHLGQRQFRRRRHLIEQPLAMRLKGGRTRPRDEPGDTSPRSRHRASRLIAELGATPKRSAAARHDAPASTAFTTRSRKSVEQAFGIPADLPASTLDQKACRP